MTSYQIEFVAPLFSRGAYPDMPEVRPASIRGQLHWWFRALGGRPEEEKSIFGGVHGGAVASKVVIRVQHPELHGEWIPTLPHKPAGRTPQDGHNAPRIGVRPGLKVDLHVLYRLGGLEPRLDEAFRQTLEAWLLLGTLGLRSTRAGGSFQWITGNVGESRPPVSFEGYEDRCRHVLGTASLRFALLDTPFSSSEEARKVVSDTLGGRNDGAGQGDLGRLHDPLGKVFGGRKTSPLRFRIVRFGEKYRIAAIWDGRDRVTGNRPSDLKGLIDLLARKKPALGDQLARSALA